MNIKCSPFQHTLNMPSNNNNNNNNNNDSNSSNNNNYGTNATNENNANNDNNKTAKVNKKKERVLFFDPFARDIELYCSIRSKRNEESLPSNNILDSDLDEDYDSDTNGYYGEPEHYKADKSKITYTQQLPTPIKHKLRKTEIVEDLGAIRKGTLGPHALVVGQTVAACVPYDDEESSDSDSGSHDRERSKERWVIAVVLGFDKKRKLYRVKDKYGPTGEHTGRGRPRAEVSWEIVPANVSRFPATRHPRCKPRDRVLALWSTRNSDGEVESDKEANNNNSSSSNNNNINNNINISNININNIINNINNISNINNNSSSSNNNNNNNNDRDSRSDEEEWTSVFYDATVVDTEDRAGYITIDYGGSSGTRSVRVDKILAISARQPRRPEKDPNHKEKEKEKDRNENENGGAPAVRKKPKSEREKPDKELRERQKDKEGKDKDIKERDKDGNTKDIKERENRDKEKRNSSRSTKRYSYAMPPIEVHNTPPLDIELLDDSRIRYYEHLLQNKASLDLYEYLLEALPWKEETVKIMGASFIESRFTVWLADENHPEDMATNGNSTVNTFFPRSGHSPSSPSPPPGTPARPVPDPWIVAIRELRMGIERVVGCAPFNVISFTYQGGSDYEAKSEDEDRPSCGTVASLTLGCDSRVKLTHRTKLHKHELMVTNGSLLVLEGVTAEHYQHVLPKLRGAAGRILVTFRSISTPDFSSFTDVPSSMANPSNNIGVSTRKRKWEGEGGDEDEEAHEEDESKDEPPPSETQRGDVLGVLPGTKFSTRAQLHEAGVHRILVGSVCGTESEGAESIILSDQDIDNGSEVYCTGAVTAKTRRKPQSSLKLLLGTQALITSCIRGLPVRVVRSSRLRSPYAPNAGFSYDGLYRVTQYWEEPAKAGQSVWRFKLSGPTPTSKPRLPPPITVPGPGGAPHHHPSHQQMHHHPSHIDLTLAPPSPPMVPVGAMGMNMGGMNMGGMGMMNMGMGMGPHHQMHPHKPLHHHDPRSESTSNSRSSGLPLHNFTLPPPILPHPSQNPSTLDPSPLHPLSPTLSPFHLRNTQRYMPHTAPRRIIDPFFLPPSHTLPPPTSQFTHNYSHPRSQTQYPPPPPPHQQHSHTQQPHHTSTHSQHPHAHLPPPPYHPHSPYQQQYPAPTLPLTRMWEDLSKQ